MEIWQYLLFFASESRESIEKWAGARSRGPFLNAFLRFRNENQQILSNNARNAGVEVDLAVWKYMCHVWIVLSAFLPEARSAVDFASDWMMQKERLISEAERIEELEQIELLRNQIEELEQEIHRVQLQLAEEIAHKMEITKKKSKLN